MAFNPDKQYRCTIIRGKSISRMDDYLSVYAQILNEICPIPAKDFDKVFDKKLSHFIKDDGKTIKNHRTENVDKLLGMYFEKDGIVYISERTKKFLENNDQPAFFKSVCFKFQQPNGSQKIQTVKEKINHGINFKPYHFVLSLLKFAAEKKIILTKDEASYYVLNALETLQGNVSFEEVLQTITDRRAKKIFKKVEISGKAYSYYQQHINEQFDYLELANLIRKDAKNIWLNAKESTSIELFIKDLAKPLMINYAKYDLINKNIGKKIEHEWREYFGAISEAEAEQLQTTIESLETIPPAEAPRISLMEVGDEGEEFVLKIERDRVKAFNPRLVNKVNHHGKIKGLGYDITSIEADRNKNNPEYARYIEVKSTKRVHPPDFTDTFDTITLTRNEWVAAEQHSSSFYIYRLYFTTKGIFLSVIKNPAGKSSNGILYATPIAYRIEFGDKAVDEKQTFA